MMALERLHKVLAHAGFGSRRACEKLIREGLVEVDGQTVVEMGVKVDPDQDRIKCQGRWLRPVQKRVFLLNKPKNFICSAKDERGRRTVIQLMAGVRERIYPVGRLDADSQGMLLMTNDGDLTERLTHPRYGIARTYHVVAEGKITPQIIEKMSRGVWLSEGKTGPLRVEIKKQERDTSILEVTVHEGMNREVRRVLAKFGLEVKRLKRIKIGELALGPLPEGRFRTLSPAEIEMLFKSAKVGTPPPKNRKAEVWKGPRPGIVGEKAEAPARIQKPESRIQNEEGPTSHEEE